jgi:hypothetical protein
VGLVHDAAATSPRLNAQRRGDTTVYP